MLQAMQQKFERMGVVFNEIQDRMDRQESAIAILHEGRPQRVRNARRQEGYIPIDESDDKNDDEFDNEGD